MPRRSGGKPDPKKLGIMFQVAPDVAANVQLTFASMGFPDQEIDSNDGMNTNVQVESIGPPLVQLGSPNLRFLGVAVATTLSTVATKMVGLHFEGTIEIANLVVPQAGPGLPPVLPYAAEAGQVVQAYVSIEAYHLPSSEAVELQTYAGFQPNKLTPIYSPERRLLLSSYGIVSFSGATNTTAHRFKLKSSASRNFEKGDSIGIAVISVASQGSLTQVVPLTVSTELIFWLQN